MAGYKGLAMRVPTQAIDVIDIDGAGESGDLSHF